MPTSLDRIISTAPKECGLFPFWFWNDRLDAQQLLDQLDAFERNGVYGFVIHPRVGLPRDQGWMSRSLLDFYRLVIEQADRRGMKVLLYDEGMYPSGSSCGQVVARWPELACRGLVLHPVNQTLPQGAIPLAEVQVHGVSQLVIDRPVNSYIRGLHYRGEGPDEDEPPASDLLNPRTAQAVIELVYDRFYSEFGSYFGSTILGIFTDEPNPLGKCREKGVQPGTTHILTHVNRILGYDFTPYLGKLWENDESARAYREDYLRAIRWRLEETWYQPLSQWCKDKGIALCGHPDRGDEIGVQRYFQIPGQDAVWRWVLPDHPSALEGPESTQAKCSSSAMIHLGRRRNSNEFAGAYGPETTFEEVQWLANWCLIRGVNLLIPHAFYYSIRGPRRHERPPQIGPHTPQWDNGFKEFADHCRRVCWLNTDSRHVCSIAVLTHHDRCPWPAASVILKAQQDFNYLDPHTLLTACQIDSSGIRIQQMHYRALVIDSDTQVSPQVLCAIQPLARAGRVKLFGSQDRYGLFAFSSGQELVEQLKMIAPPPLTWNEVNSQIRCRIIQKEGVYCLMLFNESLKSHAQTSFKTPDGDQVIRFSPGEFKVIELPSSWIQTGET